MDLSPTSGSPVWETAVGKRSPHNIWLWNPVGIMPKRVEGRLTGLCTNSLALSSSTDTVVWEVSELHGEELNWLSLGQGPEGQRSVVTLWDRSSNGFHYFFVSFVVFFFHLSLSINLANTIYLILVFPWYPTPPNPLTLIETFPRSSRTTTHSAGLGSHRAFPKQPQAQHK